MDTVKITILETAPAVMPKNNIVVIQCLFRNLLTSKQLNVSTSVITPRVRRGLDFELYYHLPAEVMRKLLDTTLLVTNCRGWRSLVDSDQIVDILAPYQPFSGFLTDSKGDQIVGDEMSPASQKILRQRAAQNENFSVFRFSFFNAGYSSAWAELIAAKDTGEILPVADYIKVIGKSGRSAEVYRRDDPSTRLGLDKVEFVYPFLTSGYWTGFAWNPDSASFVKNSDIASPFVPALVRGRYRNDQSSMFQSVVNNSSDLDWSKLTGFLEKAISTAAASGLDFRAKLRESDYIEYVAHMLDESMLDKAKV